MGIRHSISFGTMTAFSISVAIGSTKEFFTLEVSWALGCDSECMVE